MEALFYVGVSPRALLFFVGYAVKTPPLQKGILLHEVIKDVGFIFCFVFVINCTGKAIRQWRNLFVAPRKKGYLPRLGNLFSSGFYHKIRTGIRL